MLLHFSFSLKEFGGAAAAGGLAFLLCQTHCPGGVTGAIGGMMGAMNPLSLFSKKDEDEPWRIQKKDAHTCSCVFSLFATLMWHGHGFGQKGSCESTGDDNSI